MVDRGTGAGTGLWPSLWEESPSKSVPPRTQDFHFNAPWQAALLRTRLKARGKAFKNTLITNNSWASPHFPPRGSGRGERGGPSAQGSFTCACHRSRVKALASSHTLTPVGQGLELLFPSGSLKASPHRNGGGGHGGGWSCGSLGQAPGQMHPDSRGPVVGK